MHVATGVPCFTLVGLPAKSVREAEQRTRSALLSSEQRWPPARVVANLAPGALRKEGTHFDLAIAMAVLAADGRLETEPLKDWIFMGELGLDGSVRSINGVLAAAIAGRTLGRKGLVCARGNASEAAMVEGIDVIPVSTLSQCIRFFKGDWMPDPIDPSPVKRRSTSEDMSDVRGQETP
ncbi:MAG TPA: magnesium chelatase domain-containing protein, partial [Actinomycetota bacterium]|nr:magnesium chelatase domain-containing protein [Actinomycetota bacterium]